MWTQGVPNYSLPEPRPACAGPVTITVRVYWLAGTVRTLPGTVISVRLVSLDIVAGFGCGHPHDSGRENCATDRRYGGCGDGRVKPGHDGLGLVLSGLGLVLDGLGLVLSGLGLVLSGLGLVLDGLGLVLSGLRLVLSGLGLVLDGLGLVQNGLGLVLNGFRLVPKRTDRGSIFLPPGITLQCRHAKAARPLYAVPR